jgi:hypothetical protein
MKKEIIIAMILIAMPSLVSAITFLSPNPYHIGNAYPGDTKYYNLTIFNEYFKNVSINLIVNSSSGNLTCDFNGNSTTEITIPTLGTVYPKVNYSVSPAVYPGDHSCYVQIYVPDLIPPYIFLLSPPNASAIRAGTPINLTVTDNVNVSNVWYTRSIFYDTFSTSSGTATDNSWTFSDGTWIVVNGQLTQNGNITQTYAFAGDTSWTNYILESRLKANSSNADTYVGVNFRVQSDNKSYWVGIHNDNSIEVWRLDTYPGSWTQLSDWSGYTFDSSWHTMKVRAIGSNFDVYWDGNYVNSFSDNTYASGKIGLHTAYSTYVTAQFDDVKISTIESALFSGSVNFAQVNVDTTSWPDDLTVLDVYANDTSNNLNHTIYLFTIDSTGPTITFVYPTPPNGTRGKDNWIFVNTTVYDPSNVSTCTLEWNGINETMNKIGTSSAICFINKTTTDGLTYIYRVYASDILGNEASSNLMIFKENSRPTLVNISSNVTCVEQNNPVNITTVNALDADSDSLTLFVNSSNLCNVTGQPELSCVFLTSWSNTGSHTIYGSVNDSWETSYIRTLSISSDNSGPNSPTSLNPINNSITNSIPTFSWSTSTDIGCNGIVNRYRLQVHSGSSCSGSAIKSKEGNMTSWTFSDYSFENGTYSWKVRARDGFNTWGNWSTCMRLFIDSIPPRVENSSIPTIELGENANISLNVWDENGVDKVILERYSDLYKFDFGMDTSPVENGYTKITTLMLKNSSNNYGWFTSPSGDRNRSTGISPINLTRDLIFDSVDRTFLINLTNGKYLVTAIIGDKDYPHDMMDVYAEEQLKLNNINTSAGEIKWLNFTVNVLDGQLNITFHDDGGSDLNWVSNGLIIKSLVQSYNMNKTANNTYKVVIPNPPLGEHTVLYFANDTLGNVNNTVIDSFKVISPPPAKVTSVNITPSIIFNNSIYVGTGNIRFNITFDRNMNISVPLSVTYGNVTPYNTFTVFGNWTSPKTWSGISNINSSISNGNYTLNITGKDAIGNFIQNTSNWFMIDTNLPRVVSIILTPSVGYNPSYVKAGNISFMITFNKNMNQSIPPIVTFGRSPPYSTYTVSGSWVNNTTWVGYYYFSPAFPNYWYTLSISGAKDLIGREVKDTSFRFLVDTRTPRIWDILTSDITIEENETISAKVKDETPMGQESSGLDKVIVELNGASNFTMKFGYEINYIGGSDYVYYLIINNTNYTSGNQSLKFYVSDVAGNINNNATAYFYVNATIPKIGGKIAFLCRDDTINNTCYDDIESSLISWLRKQGWTVDVKAYYMWNKTNLLGYNLMMCSDERYACDYGTKGTTDVYYMHKNNKIPFVEISDDNSLRASKNFGYVNYPGGSTETNINNLYVTISHPITTGYFGNMQIFNINRTMTSISDNLLSGVKDIADAGNENMKSTLFSNDKLGRFVYIGWFYQGFNGMNSLGNTTLSRAISWAQCGNAKGCAFINNTCNSCVNPSTGLCNVNCSGNGHYCNDADTATCTCNVTECGGKSPGYSWCYLGQYRYDCQGCGGHHFIEDCGLGNCNENYNGTSWCGAVPTTTTTTTTIITTTSTVVPTTTLPLTCNNACKSLGYKIGRCKYSCSSSETGLIGNYCQTPWPSNLKCCCANYY